MIIQSSYNNDKCSLYVVPTPIGNLKDITERSILTLKSVDVIFCEDKRISVKLLNHYGIKTKLDVYHEFNSDYATNKIINYLENNQNVAIITDAGMPGISDPGFEVIKIVKEHLFNVVILPGPSAFLVASVYANIEGSKFLFFGFLSKKKSQKITQITEINSYDFATIIYESPHKILSTLEVIDNHAHNCHLTVCREISKKFEHYVSGYSTEVKEYFENFNIKGEFVIVIKPSKEIPKVTDSIYEQVDKLIKSGMTKKNSIKLVSKNSGISKNEVYQEVLELGDK